MLTPSLLLPLPDTPSLTSVDDSSCPALGSPESTGPILVFSPPMQMLAKKLNRSAFRCLCRHIPGHKHKRTLLRVVFFFPTYYAK